MGINQGGDSISKMHGDVSRSLVQGLKEQFGYLYKGVHPPKVYVFVPCRDENYSKPCLQNRILGEGSFIFIRFNLLISFKYTDQMVHDYESINKGSGENLAYFQPGDPNNMPTQCQGPKNPSCVQCREMVADWYSEESNFDYRTGKSKGGVILHSTQVVWKETTELSAGNGDCHQRRHVVFCCTI